MENIPSREEELAEALGASETIKLPQRGYSPIEMAIGKPLHDVEVAKAAKLAAEADKPEDNSEEK